VTGVRARAGVALALVVLTVGCSREPNAKDAQADLDESRSAVQAEVKAAARVLAGGDWQVSGVGGGFRRCGGGGLAAAAVEYSAGGDVKGGAGTQAERIRTASKMLEDAGWKLVVQGHGARAGEYSRLTRHGFELSIDRDQLQGSQDFGFGVSGECVEATDQANNLPGREKLAP
jgi:hypothetical protein